jgi:hypothetical protein
MDIHVFLNLALVGGEWLASLSSRFTPGDRTPGTHWIGGWVGLRTGVDDVDRDSNSDPSAVLSVVSRYTNCAIPDTFTLTAP